MEEFTIKKISLLIITFLLLFISCNNRVKINIIPQDIVITSTRDILTDKKFSRHIYLDVCIEKNILVNSIKPFEVDTFKINMIGEMKVNEKIKQNLSVISFYKYVQFTNGSVEVEFYISTTNEYVKMHLTKSGNNWICTEKESWINENRIIE